MISQEEKHQSRPPASVAQLQQELQKHGINPAEGDSAICSHRGQHFTPQGSALGAVGLL